MISQLLFLFNLKKKTYSADGSGSSFIDAVESSYPNAEWDDETCRLYDRSWYPTTYKRVTTTYLFPSVSNIDKVCGYGNSKYLKDVFRETSVVRGTKTTFQDNNAYDAANLQKRIYCIYVTFKSYNTIYTHNFECSVGLSWVSIRVMLAYL